MSVNLSPDKLNQFLFNAFTSKRNKTEDRRLFGHHYGKIIKEENIKFKSKYSNYNISIQQHGDNQQLTDDFEINMSFFRPKNIIGNRKITTLILIHGVPVNLTEFYPLANIIGNQYNILMIDLLGMGKSSQPHMTNKWSFELHAKIYNDLINEILISGVTKIKDTPIKKFVDSKLLFLVCNDWGTGVGQVLANKAPHIFKGVCLISSIVLSNYWVTEIGSLVALAEMEYNTPGFEIYAKSFVGEFTKLLKRMHHKTSRDLNQNILQNFEEIYIDSSNYENPIGTPANTEYNFWNIKCLALQASNLLGKGQLLPMSKTNPGGLDFTKFDTNFLLLHGDKDEMMPQQDVPKLKYALDKVIILKSIKKNKKEIKDIRLTVSSGYIYNAGHFATSDQPYQVAHHLIDWIDKVAGSLTRANEYLGLDVTQRGDFKYILEESKNITINGE